MKRRTVAGLIGLAVVIVAAVLLWPCGPRPCRATFEQVREGMTLEEVCATVGGPPGDYTDGARESLSVLNGPRRGPIDSWITYEGELRIGWTDQHTVERAEVDKVIDTSSPPLLDRVRIRLGF